jgi:twitching motility protein PilT
MGSDSTETKQSASLQIQQLFKAMVDSGASDLHITQGTPPGMRISGDIVRVKTASLTPDDTKRLVYQILTEQQKSILEKNLELDFSFGVKGLGEIQSQLFLYKRAL